MVKQTEVKTEDQESDASLILIPATVKVPLIAGLSAVETKRLFIASVLKTEQDIKPLDYEIEGETVKTKIVIK